MKNKIIYGLLFLPLFIMGSIMAYYLSVSNFQKVRIAVEGYDPKNLISGYYMQLSLNWQKTDCKQFKDNICPQFEFNRIYNFYINLSQSPKLSEVVNSGRAELLFSYQKGKEPLIVDLLIDGQTYKKYLQSNY